MESELTDAQREALEDAMAVAMAREADDPDLAASALLSELTSRGLCIRPIAPEPAGDAGDAEELVAALERVERIVGPDFHNYAGHGAALAEIAKVVANATAAYTARKGGVNVG